MKKIEVFFFMLFLMILSIAHYSVAQQINKEDNYPADINKYEFLKYSGGQEALSPKAVVKAENNWEILLACLRGKTREELKEMGVTFTESQLMLLYAMKFIDYIKDSNTEKVITTLPILGFKEKRSLIKRVRKLAYEIEPELSKDIYALKEVLKKIGCEERTFSILFSAVIDGIVWFPFIAQGFVTEFELTPQKPLYDGVYWAYYPKRDFRCGTNIALGNDVLE